MSRSLILALNAGSSSLKFAAYGDTAAASLDLLASGAVTRIKEPSPEAEFARSGHDPERVSLADSGHGFAVRTVLDWLGEQLPAVRIRGVGHRVVHGGDLPGHAIIDDEVEAGIEQANVLAPIHNPPALEVIWQARSRLGGEVPMAAAFDTAFFADLDPRARHYAIPWELAHRHGIRRFGFHGIAHQSMLESAARLLGRSITDMSLITFQLGNGCSSALIRHGRAVDTTMGMTPLEGLMMGTRSGTIDPALVSFIADREHLSASQVTDLLNDESGLLGVSGLSSDMRDVMAAAAAGDARASLAFEMFAYRIRKQIGAFVAAGGPIDAVVFGGGIGERAAELRRAVCADLVHLGIQIDGDANRSHDGGNADISAPGATMRTLLAEVDELRVIAEITGSLIV